MEGGMSYLKAVVVDDLLGLANAFEQEMQTLINNYKCEWKEVVDSPELRKRYNHFVNVPEKDPTIVFEEMRTQKRAKEWV